MTPTSDLNKMGLVPISDLEMENLGGGGWNPFVALAEWLGGKILDSAIEKGIPAYRDTLVKLGPSGLSIVAPFLRFYKRKNDIET